MLLQVSSIFSVLLFSQLAFAQARVEVRVTLYPAGSFVAKTSKVKGTATVAGGKAKATNIVVDLTSLTTGIDLRDKHMRTKYLETDKFPEAILISAEGEGGKGKGKIKIRGIEKDIEGTYRPVAGGHEAKFKLKISDFIKKEVSYLGVGAEDEIDVVVMLPVK